MDNYLYTCTLHGSEVTLSSSFIKKKIEDTDIRSRDSHLPTTLYRQLNFLGGLSFHFLIAFLKDVFIFIFMLFFFFL
ncbi:hypothetical protein HMI54_015271 [Coelomomyces lativittatus]|nr:hypothetical protein HMI54_015271 [Coelomomyces lativittatus]